MKPASGVLLCALFCLPAVAAESPQVAVSLSPKTALIGDHVEIRTIVKTSELFDGIKVSFKPGADVDVIAEQSLPAKVLPQYNLYEQVTTVACFRVGDISLGPFKVTFFKNGSAVGTMDVDPQTVVIQSVLKEEDKDISPLKPLSALPGNALYFLRFVAAGAAIILLAFGIRFWLGRKRRQAEAVLPEPDPETELSALLEELLARNWLQKGEYRQFFIHLTEIWKRFLHRYYRFPAEDFTSSETLSALGACETEERFVCGVRQLLETADGVKFARKEPQQDELHSILGSLRGMVQGYQARKQAAAEAGHAPLGQ